MRKKVRKSLAFLLALALVVSVMSGLGLSVSADDAQNEPVVTETEGEPAEEKLKAEESTPKEGEEEEEADPDAEAVPEEKKDVKKAEGEGSGDESPVKDTTADSNGEQKDEPQAEPAAEEQDAPVEEDSVPVVQADGEVNTYTITCGGKQLTVKLYDENNNQIKGIAPKNLTIKKDTATSVNDYVAEVEGYTYSSAYYYYNHWYYGKTNAEIGRIAYYDNYDNNGWYSVDRDQRKIVDDTIYLVYKENADINDSFTVYYVDENGMEIGNKTQTVTVNGDKSIVFKNYATPIDGYTYWRACYSSANNAEVTKAVLASSGWQGTYYTFYNGSKKLTTPSKNYDTDTVEDISKLHDIYLVYVKDGIVPTPGSTTGGGGTEVAEPTHNKTAKLQGDGTYDISLDVSGSVGTDEKKAILDVVYVLDVSGSMSYSMQDDDNSSNEKLEKAKAAIETMTNSLANNNKIAARFSLVKFSRTAQTVRDWTSNANALNTSLDMLSAGGGTNYEAAFIEAKKLLENKNPQGNASKVVIFVSDGDPTLYSSNAYGNGRNDVDGRAMSRARGVVKTMLLNYLFTVGVGPEKNYSQLSKVTDAAHEGVNMGVTSVNFVGTDENSLKTAFKIMEGSITSIACQNVTIRDKLSTNVAMVMADGKPKKLKGEVTDKNGKLVGTYNSADGSIALPATDLNGATTLPKPTYENGEIVWNLPDDYKLEANYTYTVTANVDVTETAFKHYREGNNETPNQYTDLADAGTGTHAGKYGLFSNDNENAKLIYTVTGESEPKEVNYQKPVVRLTPSKLTIKKTVTGLDAEALAKLKNQLTFDVTYSYTKNNETKKVPVRFSEFKQEGDSNTYTYTSNELNCWSMDATYTVEEKGFVVEGYDRTNSATTATGKIEGRNRDAIASFTNNYQHKNVTVTIKKEVTGNMSQTSDKFTFDVTNPNNLADRDKSFELSADNTDGKTISIPYGSSFTIRETPSNGYTLTKVNDKNVNDNSYTIEKVTQNTTIIFTNKKEIQPPNGIITTIAPYAIMVVLAAGAGVYFVYSRRRRNR